MISVVPYAVTQTEFDQVENQILPKIALRKKLLQIRRSSMKPYYYNEIGDICSNPLPAMITCSTFPESPLKYRNTGCKFEEVLEKNQKKRKAVKEFNTTCTTIPLKSGLYSKEVFVMDSSTESPNTSSKGFYYQINRSKMSRYEKQENLKHFLLSCQHKFKKHQKFKFISSTSGKIFQFLQDIPFTEKILLVSHNLSSIPIPSPQSSFFQSQFSKLEEKFSNKTSNFSSSQVTNLPPNTNPIDTPVKPAKYSFNQLKVKLGQTAVKIDTELPKIFDLGMSNLRKKCKFCESDIHKLYAKYKTLLHLSIAKNPAHSIKDGISKEMFVESYSGTPELNFVLARIFDCIDQDCNGAIVWDEYLAAMDVMFNGTYEQKIDLLFTVYDTDGNGNLDFEEIKNVCKLQLQNSDADNVIEELSHSFATLIFNVTETQYDKEIPAVKIKEGLTRQKDKSLIEMFCSFSFMNNN